MNWMENNLKKSNKRSKMSESDANSKLSPMVSLNDTILSYCFMCLLSKQSICISYQCIVHNHSYNSILYRKCFWVKYNLKSTKQLSLPIHNILEAN